MLGDALEPLALRASSNRNIKDDIGFNSSLRGLFADSFYNTEEKEFRNTNYLKLMEMMKTNPEIEQMLIRKQQQITNNNLNRVNPSFKGDYNRLPNNLLSLFKTNPRQF